MREMLVGLSRLIQLCLLQASGVEPSVEQAELEGKASSKVSSGISHKKNLRKDMLVNLPSAASKKKASKLSE